MILYTLYRPITSILLHWTFAVVLSTGSIFWCIKDSQWSGTFCAFCLMSGLMWMSAPVISRTEKTFACFKSQTHTDGGGWWKWENHTLAPSSLALLYRVMSGLIGISDSSLSERMTFVVSSDLSVWSASCISNIHTGQSLLKSLWYWNIFGNFWVNCF